MNYIIFDTISSTNQYIKDNYQKLDNLSIVAAKHQTNGRGRLGRTWMDDNDLLFSILIKKDNNNLYKPNLYSLVIAKTINSVLNELEIKSLVKWPNDIIVNDKKICGILLEGVTRDDLECVVIGVGLNTNSTIFKDNLQDKATSIKNVLNIEDDIDNINLLNMIQKQFINDYNEFNSDYSKCIDYISNHSYLQNKNVVFNYLGVERKGMVIGINDEGKILIQINDKILELSSGEITLEKNYK